MFNLFRKKHKRSEWFEGLLDAEGLMEASGRHSTSNYYYIELYAEEDNEDFKDGFVGYLRYHQAVLSRI